MISVAENFEAMQRQIKDNINQMIATEKLHEAQNILHNYMEMVTDDPEAFSIQAVIAFSEGRLEEARQALLSGLELDKRNFDIQYNLAHVYESQEEYLKAAEVYRDLNNTSIYSQEQCSFATQALETLYDNQPQFKQWTARKRLVFFIKKGLDSFIDEIISGLSAIYETKKIIVTNLKQIDDEMTWADICWFEWCDELIIYGSKLQLAQKKKIICRLHSYEAFTDWPPQVQWQNVNLVIFVANFIRDFVVENAPSLKTSQTIVIPNGIDTDKYTFAKRKPGFNIAYVGYINYKKGPMLLLHAFKAIFDKDQRYKLFIAGTFQDHRYLLYFQQMVKEMGIEKNVIFNGWQKNLNQWLEDKNYILCTSVLESQNLSVMQAMAKGIKPLVHNFVGAREVYSPKYIWNTIDECVNLLINNSYNSEEYRLEIQEKYSLREKLERIIHVINDLESSQRKNQIATTFDYATYWNNRLSQKFDIEGVGYIGLGTTYNQQLYSIRLDILKYIIQNLFSNNLFKKHILELGPGIGMFTRYFSSHKASYKAIDITKKSVEELRKKYNKYQFIQGDITDSSLYEANKHDLIFAADVLLHLTNEEKYKVTIKNIASSLNEQGYVILFDPISILGTKSQSAHMVIRDINYIQEICLQNDLELVAMLPSAFCMNFPFDKDAANLGVETANIFAYIQKIFSSEEIKESDKQVIARWLTSFEKICLVHFGYGFSQKVVILKKVSNKTDLNLTINKVWNLEAIAKEYESLKQQVSLLALNNDFVLTLKKMITKMQEKI